jgi:hypothetical protein
MKNKVKRTIYLILIAIILFSASMAVPSLYNSEWRMIMQGAAVGLLIAGSITIVKSLTYKGENN